MKKFLAILMAIAMVFSLAACGAGGTGDKPEAKLKVGFIFFTMKTQLMTLTSSRRQRLLVRRQVRNMFRKSTFPRATNATRLPLTLSTRAAQ